MNARCVIIAPISGVEDTKKGEIFEHLINVCSEITETKPVVVLDTKTRWRGKDGTVRKLSTEMRQVGKQNDACPPYA